MKNPDDFAPQRISEAGAFAPEVKIDFGNLLARMLRNWYWFVLAVALCVAAAFAHLRYATPVYQAKTSMLIQEQSGGQAGLSKEVLSEQLGFENTYVIANELYMLNSNYMMERVVEQLGLDVTYVHQGAVRDIEIYQPEAFTIIPADSLAFNDPSQPTRYGSVQVRFDDREAFSLIRAEGDTIAQPYTQSFTIGNRPFTLQLTEGVPLPPPTDVYSINVMNPFEVAGKYAFELGASQVERSGVVNLSISDPIPRKARDILNTLVLVYEQEIVEQQSQTGGQTLAFIEERLEVVTNELGTIESDLTSFKRNANLSVDIQTRGADYLTQMNEADAQLAELSVRSELIEDIRRTLTDGEDTYEPLPLASEVISGVLSDLILEYNQEIFRRQNTLESVTEDHPLVATYNETLSNTKSSILRSINAILRETNERRSRIEGRIQPLQSQMTAIPASEQRMLEIMRQRDIKQNLFIFLLEKREEAALSIAAQVPNTRTIDRAVSSSFPISPNPPVIYLLAIGVGLFVPAGVMFLRELLGTTLTTEKEISSFLPYPVVGRIIKSKDHGKLLVNKSNRSGIAEAFRLLRTNLNYLLPGDKPSVILVTSSISGEGKSFIAGNLGAALAISSKRVVVIGMDMRKPKLAEMVLQVKEKTTTGLSNYLIGKADYSEIVLPTEQENLSIIPSGPQPPNPAELLMEPRMAALMQRLREDFDVIVLDAPPVGIVTDGLLLKEFVNVTLFVTRVGVTPKRGMSYITEMVETGKLPRFSLIVNGIDPRTAYGYGYGYYE